MDIHLPVMERYSFLRLQLVDGNRFAVRLVIEFASESLGLSGSSPETHYYRHDGARFLEDLRAFSHAHQAEARLESFDGTGFDIRVYARDMARQVGLELRMTYAPARNAYDLRILWELDPSRWQPLFADLQAVLDATNHDPQP
jgi:hypothetical protein